MQSSHAMKMNIHVRLALYALYVTTMFGSLPFLWRLNVPLILFIYWTPEVIKLIRTEDGNPFETVREVNGRALILGFLAFLVIFWVGGLYIAFHFDPSRHPMRLILGVLGLLWLASLYPGYRWWRGERSKAAA
jgi:hypothetical protein